MTTYGFTLSSEEFAPLKLVETALQAEETGFEFALISDHYHPWISTQGQSNFVWATLGAIANITRRLRVGTGVTCPIMRYHPAIIAQASATVASLFEGRFFLGVGAGENLNEHIIGGRWPRAQERLEMLAEAIEIIRELWKGGKVSHNGKHYTVDEARLYTLPEESPELYIAASGPGSARLAAEAGDGLIGVAPDADLISEFRKGGGDKPAYGQVHVCYAESEEGARETVKKWWPQGGLSGDLNWETKTPELFEAAVESISAEKIVEHISCGPDAERHTEAILEYAKAGYSHVYLHQIGPDQEGFLKFYNEQLRDVLGAANH